MVSRAGNLFSARCKGPRSGWQVLGVAEERVEERRHATALLEDERPSIIRILHDP